MWWPQLTCPSRDVSFIVLWPTSQQEQQPSEREMIDFKVKLRNLSQRRAGNDLQPRQGHGLLARTETLAGSNQRHSLPWHSINSIPSFGAPELLAKMANVSCMQDNIRAAWENISEINPRVICWWWSEVLRSASSVSGFSYIKKVIGTLKSFGFLN